MEEKLNQTVLKPENLRWLSPQIKKNIILWKQTQFEAKMTFLLLKIRACTLIIEYNLVNSVGLLPCRPNYKHPDSLSLL
jgi:hypothetical protein